MKDLKLNGFHYDNTMVEKLGEVYYERDDNEDDCNQGEEASPIELLPSPVYDDEGCLLQPPADESLNEENTEWQDAHNTPRHS